MPSRESNRSMEGCLVAGNNEFCLPWKYTLELRLIKFAVHISGLGLLATLRRASFAIFSSKAPAMLMVPGFHIRSICSHPRCTKTSHGHIKMQCISFQSALPIRTPACTAGDTQDREENAQLRTTKPENMFHHTVVRMYGLRGMADRVETKKGNEMPAILCAAGVDTCT